MVGESLASIGFTEEIVPPYVSAKEAVFPFTKFREFDPILGPEMRSTGEVMGIADSFGAAFLKAQVAADNALPSEGAVFVTVNDRDKAGVTPIAHRFHEMGFRLYATEGTAKYLRSRGVPCERVFKLHGGRPNGFDLLVNGEVGLLINTPLGKHAQVADYTLRQAAIARRVPYTTTLSAANAALRRHPVAPVAGAASALAAGVAHAAERGPRGGGDGGRPPSGLFPRRRRSARRDPRVTGGGRVPRRRFR
jgi:carbamoyl-phosphate synthase large subunit